MLGSCAGSPRTPSQDEIAKQEALLVGKPIIDLTHQSFSRLFVLERSQQKLHGTAAHWICLCDCGNIIIVSSSHLRAASKGKGKRSCGCLYDETRPKARAIVMEHPGEYRSWRHMRDRCLNRHHKHYSYYGGRGIIIDPRWDDFAVFLVDVGPKPSPKHTIDRYPDQDGNYVPGNVRWATMLQQANNTRGNHLYTINGETHTVAEWARLAGQEIFRVRIRLSDGWTIERALFTPVQSQYDHSKH